MLVKYNKFNEYTPLNLGMQDKMDFFIYFNPMIL